MWWVKLPPVMLVTTWALGSEPAASLLIQLCVNGLGKAASWPKWKSPDEPLDSFLALARTSPVCCRYQGNRLADGKSVNPIFSYFLF